MKRAILQARVSESTFGLRERSVGIVVAAPRRLMSRLAYGWNDSLRVMAAGELFGVRADLRAAESPEPDVGIELRKILSSLARVEAT